MLVELALKSRSELSQVRKEQKHIKRTVIKSVVATLDLCLRHLMHGESFPGVEPEFMLLLST